MPSLAIPDCRVTEWEQMNALTHWLDASNVYGSTARERGDVREQRTQASPFLVQKTVLYCTILYCTVLLLYCTVGAGQDGPRAAAQLPPGEAEDPRHPPHHELRGGEQR